MYSKEKQDKLREIFKEFDTNGDGQLDEDELIAGYTKLHGNEQQAIAEVKLVMDAVDVNKNGNIDYTGIYIYIYIILEFLMVHMDMEEILGEGKLQAAFNLFDLVIIN